MTLRERYEQKLAELREDDDYCAIELALAVATAIRRQMREKGVTQAALARRLGVSPARISQLLKSGEATNMTIGTLARLAKALDARVDWDFRHLVGEDTKDWVCSLAQPDVVASRSEIEEQVYAIPLAA